MSPLPDFIDVQLSAAGAKAVGDGSLRVANAHFHYEFKPGAPVKVTRKYEWGNVLSQLAIEGEPLLEPAPERPAKKSRTAPAEAAAETGEGA